MNLPKAIWTESDFEQMNWHDCALYGFAFEYLEEEFQNNLLLDLDCILEWLEPADSEDVFQFLTAPATLVFENVWNFVMGVDYKSTIAFPLKIYEIQLLDKVATQNGFFEYSWKIVLTEGSMTLSSSGYQQIVRKAPQLSSKQSWGLEERGGISFSKTPYDQDETNLIIPE